MGKPRAVRPWAFEGVSAHEDRRHAPHRPGRRHRRGRLGRGARARGQPPHHRRGPHRRGPRRRRQRHDQPGPGRRRRSKLLRPLLIGERADEPARVSEKLRQHTFWQGRGGAVEHAISGIDIALWDLFGKVCNQPVARLLGGNYRDTIKPYGSILFDEPDAAAREAAGDGRPRLQGDQARLAAVRPARREDRRAADPDGPRDGRPGRRADGRCRRQRAVLAARLQVGAANGADARRLRRRLVRGGAAAGRPRGLHRAAPPRRRCRSRRARC